MRNYRNAFLLALVGNLVFASVLAAIFWRMRRPVSARQAESARSVAAAPSTPGASPNSSERPGETALVPVQISPERMQSIGVEFGAVERKVVGDTIRTTGNVAVDETRLSYVQTRFVGWIQKVFADATYQYVHKGQPLFTIYSPELATAEREYVVAKQNASELSQSSISGVAAGIRALLEGSTERLRQWNVPQREIARLESSGQVQQELEIDSPVSGYITERNALPNLYVQPETRLYTVADLSTVWVQVQVFQYDLGGIKIGDPATLTVDTFPGRTFRGRVDFIYPQVDMDTRTARVRIIFPNPGLQLKPGMFVNVSLNVPMGRQLVIPANAVLQSGTRQIVFVSRSEGYLEPREVQLGARAGDDFIVLKGLAAGEKVVTSANFLVDSESELQAALGSFAPPPPGAGAAAAVNTPHANVELSSEPDPPRKGNNIFRAKITDSSGTPISGAEVSVTFFMAAMPDMGMPAMRTAVTLSEKGSGTYEGSGRLQSAGTWQVTIVARKDGQTIASKRLSVRSVGGM
jgi:RND family efflux transporter MFP subunit